MKKVALASTLGLMISLPAMAVETPFYAAIDAGIASYGDDLNTACARVAGTAGASCKKTDTAYRFSAGYRFTDNFGVEAGYGNYGKTTVSNAVSTGSVQASAFQVAATAILPVYDKLSLTAKLGVASVSAKGTATGALAAAPVLASSNVRKTNFVWGVGAEYALTPTVSLRGGIEDLGTAGNASTIGSYKVTSVSAGAVFKF
jgi:OOP family OmpA-OmpF porin